MKKLRFGLIALLMLLCMATSAMASLSIGIGLPNVSIGINLPVFPVLTRVPGYPVYYAPQMDANYFFYDGMYWVYQDDNWYASSWYNGPWAFVEPYAVPLFILRVPVSYYRQPPMYFRGWQSNAPPRWGQHWGHEWEQRRGGWDKWKRSAAPAPAPLPVYQRKYSGDRYPRVEQQQALRSQSYRYQPRDTVVREHLKQQGQQNAPAGRGRPEAPPVKTQHQPDPQRPAPLQQGAPAGPHTQPPQRGGEQVHQSAPAPQPHATAPQEQRRQPEAQHQQQAPRAQGQDQRSQERGGSQEPNRDRGQGQNRDDDRGRGRDR